MRMTNEKRECMSRYSESKAMDCRCILFDKGFSNAGKLRQVVGGGGKLKYKEIIKKQT